MKHPDMFGTNDAILSLPTRGRGLKPRHHSSYAGRKLEAGEATTVSDLATAEGLSDRFVSRQIRIAYLAPTVVERLVVKREIPAVKISDLIDVAAKPWGEQERAAFET